METPGERDQRNLRVKKLLELFENDQVKHQEKAVIAVLGETFEDVFGPKWWCQATRYIPLLSSYCILTFVC